MTYYEWILADYHSWRGWKPIGPIYTVLLETLRQKIQVFLKSVGVCDANIHGDSAIDSQPGSYELVAIKHVNCIRQNASGRGARLKLILFELPRVTRVTSMVLPIRWMDWFKIIWIYIYIYRLLHVCFILFKYVFIYMHICTYTHI